jgi:signal transduction histidine kinase
VAVIAVSSAGGGVFLFMALPAALIASLALLGCALLLLARIHAVQAERLRGERRKISLDLHDGAIQPYLGLKLGLEALRRKALPDNPLAGDVDELYRMTQDSIAELRGYVRVLRGSTAPAGTLLDELRRQAERFQRFYGFKVEISIEPDLIVADALAAEVVQMVGEGLSNVGRHTTSRQVTVVLSAAQRRLVVEIVDHRGDRKAWRRFTPVSLTLRARRLGGMVEVAPRESGGTVVRVVIPV